MKPDTNLILLRIRFRRKFIGMGTVYPKKYFVPMPINLCRKRIRSNISTSPLWRGQPQLLATNRRQYYFYYDPFGRNKSTHYIICEIWVLIGTHFLSMAGESISQLHMTVCIIFFSGPTPCWAINRSRVLHILPRFDSTNIFLSNLSGSNRFNWRRQMVWRIIRIKRKRWYKRKKPLYKYMYDIYMIDGTSMCMLKSNKH